MCVIGKVKIGETIGDIVIDFGFGDKMMILLRNFSKAGSMSAEL
jgi:hypothetical protein